MKSNISKLLLVLASATLLAGCAGQTPTNSSDPVTSSPTESASSDSSSSGGTVAPVETEYSIIDRTGAGITITLDKTKAKKNETVTITVALDANYVLNGIYANKNACTKVNDTTYTFVMGAAADVCQNVKLFLCIVLTNAVECSIIQYIEYFALHLDQREYHLKKGRRLIV